MPIVLPGATRSSRMTPSPGFSRFRTRILRSRIPAFTLAGVLLAVPAARAQHAAEPSAARSSASHVIMPQTRSFAVHNRHGRHAAVVIEKIDALVRIRETTASTTLDIHLVNQSNARQESILLLPIPGDAAVSDFMFEGPAAEPKAEPGKPMKPVELGSAHLFVKIAGRWIDTVDANEFMQLERDGKAGEIKPLERGTPAFDAVLKDLPEPHRAAVTALDVEAVVRIGETWHRLMPVVRQEEAATTAGRVAAVEPTSPSADFRKPTDITDAAARAPIEKHFVAIDGVWVDRRLATQYAADSRIRSETGADYPYEATCGDASFERSLQTIAPFDPSYTQAIQLAFRHGSCGVKVIALRNLSPVAFFDFRC